MCYRGNHSTLGTSVKCGMSLTHQLCKPMAYTVSSRTFQHLTHTYTTDDVTTAPAADAAWPENPGSASLKRRMKRTQAALVRVPPQRADSLGGLSFSLLFQGVWWWFLHPILVPTTYPQGAWSTLSFVSLAPATGNLKWKWWLTSFRTLAISALPAAPTASSHNPVIWEQWILI